MLQLEPSIKLRNPNRTITARREIRAYAVGHIMTPGQIEGTRNGEVWLCGDYYALAGFKTGTIVAIPVKGTYPDCDWECFQIVG